MKNFVLKLLLLSFLNISVISTLPTGENDSGNFFIEEQNCFDKFVPKLKSIAEQVKNDSLACLNAGDVQFQMHAELMQALILKCSMELNTKNYFACVEGAAPETQRIFKEIAAAKEQNERKKIVCLSVASKRGKQKSENALFNLHLCLKTVSSQPKKNSTNESPPSTDMDEFLKKIDILKENYEQLKNCSTIDAFSYCWWQYSDVLRSSYDIGSLISKNTFLSNSTYFSKINEIDYTEDSCIGQSIAMHLNENFEFDLISCLQVGRKATEESEDNYEQDEQLIQNLIDVHKEFDNCRQITPNDLDTKGCVEKIFMQTKKFKECQEAISKKSEENFERLKEYLQSTYTDQYTCIGDLYAYLQFDGINLSQMKHELLFSCLKKGIKQTESLSFQEQVIKDLEEIQNYLRYCTMHPDSPGYSSCLRNIFNVNDFNFSKTSYENYEKIVAQHDYNYYSCFLSILGDFIKLFYGDIKTVQLRSSNSKECMFKSILLQTM